MAITNPVFTEAKKESDLIKKEFWQQTGWCRKEVTVNEAAQIDLTIGSVLGKVTADGKYKASDPAAVDGSQVVAAVCIENITVPATTDTTVLVAYRGPMQVAEQSLVFDVAHDAGQTAAALAELEALDISTKTQLS